jgi:NTP pyrophosphatase (non-canonical NTP hydrolase)
VPQPALAADGSALDRRRMKELQQRVAGFVREHRLETDVTHRLLDAISELGEVAKDVLKGSAYGRRRFTPGASWTNELGDVFFSLLCLANTTSVDVDVALETALAKYERRLKAHGTAGSAPEKTSRRRRKAAP